MLNKMNDTSTYLNTTLLRAAGVIKLSKSYHPYHNLKLGIWVYFFLLIFEGALRKWFLPGLSTPLMLIRDPLALWLLLSSLHRNIIKLNIYMFSMVVIGLVGVFTAAFFGHGNMLVALYGTRPLLLHFPLIFVIGRIFDREDVIEMGKALLLISIPMTVLIAFQFYSPQSAWINRGIGGDMAGAGFSGALGYFRPPGTFSFTNGNTLFYGLLAPFILYFWLDVKKINRLIHICATAGLLIAIPLSISRGLFFQVGIAFIFAVIAALRMPKYLGKMILFIIAGVIALLILSNASFFQIGTQAFTSRFESAGEVEGGLKGTLGDRYLGELTNVFEAASQQPFFGYGLGIGTNAGSWLLTGTQTFLISEGEWGRLLGELGPLMGLFVIFIRLGLSFKIALASYRSLIMGNILPWILLSFGLTTLPQAQWSQPTSLGFSVLITSLLLASFKSRKR